MWQPHLVRFDYSEAWQWWVVSKRFVSAFVGKTTVNQMVADCQSWRGARQWQETQQNIFTGERNSSRGVQCSPLSPFPLLHCHQKPALPAATGRDRVTVTWIGVPLSTPLTTGAFFYSPLQPSRTLPLVWSEIDGILRYISHGLKMHASPLVSCTSLQSCLIL